MQKELEFLKARIKELEAENARLREQMAELLDDVRYCPLCQDEGFWTTLPEPPEEEPHIMGIPVKLDDHLPDNEWHFEPPEVTG